LSLPLEFHPLVQDEIDDAHQWYEGRSPGLGDDFLATLRGALDDICANPAVHGFALADIREALLAASRTRSTTASSAAASASSRSTTRPATPHAGSPAANA
jgi:hypothetical protein